MCEHTPTFGLFMEILLMACLAVRSFPGVRAEPPVGVIEGDAAKPVLPLSMADLFQKTSPAVVKILVNGESHKGVAKGSGFVVTWGGPDSCEILTNHHVIRPGVTATVEFQDGDMGDVEQVLVEDQDADLALIEVKLRKATKSRAEINVKNHVKPPIGTRVIAIGSPQGMTNTLSDGLISGYRAIGSKEGWVQITNPIGPGSSGGPLLDEGGTFVGVTTASIEDAQNLNFAVPATAVRAFLEQKPTGRPLCKGSSINQEEKAVFRIIFDRVFQKYCSSSSDLKYERQLVEDYLNAVEGVAPVLSERNQRFRKYCEDLAQLNDPYGLIVFGWYTAHEAYFTNSTQITDGIQSLKRALQDEDRYRFFVLHAIGEAEWYFAERAREAANAQTRPTPAEYARAIESLKKARNANPDFAPSLNLLAILYTETGQNTEALSVTKALLDRVPGSATAHVQRAELLAATGSPLAAIVEFELALSLDPYHFDPARRLGQLFSQTGQHEKSIAAYSAAIAIAVPDPGRHRAEPNDAVRQSMQELDRAIIVSYGVWQIRRFIGWEYIRLTRYDEAMAMFQQAIQTPGVDDDPAIRPMLEQDIATCLRLRNRK